MAQQIFWNSNGIALFPAGIFNYFSPVNWQGRGSHSSNTQSKPCCSTGDFLLCSIYFVCNMARKVALNKSKHGSFAASGRAKARPCLRR